MTPPVLRGPYLPRTLLRFVLWMLGLAAVSILYTAVMTLALHTPSLYGVTLFAPGFHGSDFSVFGERSRLFRTAAYWDELNYPFTYPAPMAIVFALWFKVPYALQSYWSFCVAGLGTWAWWLTRRLDSLGVSRAAAGGFALLTIGLSWPVVFLLDTGNIEGLVAVVLAAGVAATLYRRPWLGATLIGLAASLKLFPFILLGLLASQRRYREFLSGWAVSAAATLGSLALLGPRVAVAQRHIEDGLRFIKMAFIFSTRPIALHYSHSLFSLLKFAVILAYRHTGHAPDRLREEALLDVVLRLYLVVVALAGLALYVMRIRKLPLLNQLLALTVYAVLVPPLSADYTLLQLLLPFGLLCVYATDCARRQLEPPGLVPCFVCFAWLFGWATFLTLHYQFDQSMRGVALCVLLVLVLRYPFPWPELDATPDAVQETA